VPEARTSGPLQPPAVAYEFGPFRLERDRRRLLRDGEPLALTAKVFETLLALVENAGRVVDKEELIARVWPDIVVEEGNLTQNVFLLRKLLGEAPGEHSYIATVPRRGYQFVAPVREAPEASGTAARAAAVPSAPLEPRSAPSLAVLPFRDLGKDRDDYLGLGMADALITRLGNIGHLMVRPTSAVWRYLGVDADPVAAGRALAVDNVLEGYLQRAGDRIRVTVQLVSVEDAAPVWGARFDERLTEVFALQDSLSARLAGALVANLSAEDKGRLSKRYTTSVEAYHLYLKGRYHLAKRTEEGLKKAEGHFQRAIALDPGFAMAHAGLADSCLLLSFFFGEGRVSESVAKARAAARRALELDDTLAEAHEVLGEAELFDWNWAEAQRALEAAIALNPGYASAYNRYAIFLAAVGRVEEGIAASRGAVEADPTSLMWNAGVAHLLYMGRRYGEAVDQALKTLEMDAGFHPAHWMLGLAYEELGRLDEAVASLERARELSGGAPLIRALLGRAHGLAGRRAEAEAALSDLEQLSAQRDVALDCFALVHTGLGQQDRALGWLERGCAERSLCVFYYLKAAPLYDRLRGDPRFTALLARMQLAG
jgi:DNA-binding winged helix-turn-helix (wHTH) protein/tetratricopeptide (TPR) repeat protein